jgi:tRNA pseudouridine38-40 synthase
MRETGSALAGTRDFSAVTNAKGGPQGTRRLDEVRVEAKEGFVDLYFSGEGFLYNQVRIMAAILLEAGLGRLSPARAVEILDGRDRSAAPGALGPFGLCLMEVRY